MSYVLTGLMIANISHIIYSGFLYLIYFRHTHHDGNLIQEIWTMEINAHREAEIFTRFFNHVTVSYFLFIILVLLEIAYLLWIVPDYTDTMVWVHITFLSLLIGFIALYRRRMIDLDMDYVVVVPGKLYFIDQVGVHRGNQTLKLVKDILIIKGSYASFIGSFLNYGTIEISTKFDRDIMVSDTPNLLDMLHMHYVQGPIETANAMNQILSQGMTNNPPPL